MVNIHQAKTHLSRLVEESAASGEAFIIAKAGKPVATVKPYVPDKPAQRKLGALNGKFLIPDDFDTLCGEEIARMFEGEG